MARTYKRKSIEQEKILDLRKELYKEDVVADVEPTAYNNTVKLVLAVSLKSYTATGKVSGKRYRWERSGSSVDVDARDVDDLMQKKYGSKPCCGNRPNYLFMKVE